MEERIKKRHTKSWQKNISFGHISLKDKAILARNLSIMLKSGLDITESLDIIISQSTGRFKRAINSITQSVIAGNSLSSSFSKFPKIFSSFYINAIRSGESSGNLGNNLADVADHLFREKELIDKIKAAMFYPLIILILSFGLGLGMAFLVLPKITPIFIGLKIDLPTTTRFLIWFSNFIENHGLILLVTLAVFIALIIWLFKQKFFKPISHLLILNLPIVSKISRNKNVALFCRTLGTLLKSGLSIDEALGITRDTLANYYYQKRLIKIQQHVSQGTKLSDDLDNYNKYFPKMAVSIIRVGEKSGNLELELFNLAHIYETEVDNTTKMLSTAIEPILLIIIGVIVGGLALSIITPIYKITGSVYR